MNSGNRELSARLLSGGKVQRKALGYIFHCLEQHGWNLTHTAPVLGITVRTLQHWIRRYPLLSQGRIKASTAAATQSVSYPASDFVVTLPEE